MYEELINRLRYCAHGACNKCEQIGQCYPGCHEQLQGEAANTIERLQAFNAMWQGAAELAHENEMKWIPVTEQMPFAESGNVSKTVLVTDGKCVTLAEWFNFEDFEPYWSYTGIGDVTHWMPLPEPPKEE